MDNKERFTFICQTLIKRPGIEDLMKWLESSDFYTSPASVRFHEAYPGGLLEHSLNVYDELNRLRSAYPEFEISDESAAIVALFHDLCKVNSYASEKRNRKNELRQWESYDAYTRKEKFCFGGHGSKSVFLVQHFMKLLPEEAVAINSHMGAYDGDKYVSDAYEQCFLAWLLHVADESATFVKTKEKEN